MWFITKQIKVSEILQSTLESFAWVSLRSIMSRIHVERDVSPLLLMVKMMPTTEHVGVIVAVVIWVIARSTVPSPIISRRQP